MFERDYIKRIIQNFFKDLNELINGRHEPDSDRLMAGIGDLYKEYLKKDRTYYYSLPEESITRIFEKDGDIYKTEMLAALLRQDGLLQNRKDLLEKSLTLYQHINEVSKDFSMDRLEAIREIKTEIGTDDD